MENNKKSWADISIGQFQKIYDLQSRNLEEDALAFEVLAVVENTTVEAIMNMPITEAREKMENIQFLYTKPRTGLIKGSYMLGGKKYRVFTNMNDFTTGQYIDFTTLYKNYHNHLAQFLSIFLIPDGKKYGNGYDIEAAQADIAKFLSVEDGLTIVGFFTAWCEVLMRLMLRYFHRQVRKNRKHLDPETLRKMEEAEKQLKIMMALTSTAFSV